MTDKQEEEIRKLRRQIAQMSDHLEQKKAEERLPKNLDFVQLARSEMRSIAELGKQSKTALELLMIFAQSMNKQNAVMMSYKAMEAITGKKERTLRNAVTVLRKGNWIQMIKVGTANAYVMNKAVFWTDKAHRKHLGSFSAEIITTLEEQNKDVRRSPNMTLKRVPTLEAGERGIIDTAQELPPPDQTDLDLD